MRRSWGEMLCEVCLERNFLFHIFTDIKMGFPYSLKNTEEYTSCQWVCSHGRREVNHLDYKCEWILSNIAWWSRWHFIISIHMWSFSSFPCIMVSQRPCHTHTPVVVDGTVSSLSRCCSQSQTWWGVLWNVKHWASTANKTYFLIPLQNLCTNLIITQWKRCVINSHDTPIIY